MHLISCRPWACWLAPHLVLRSTCRSRLLPGRARCPEVLLCDVSAERLVTRMTGAILCQHAQLRWRRNDGSPSRSGRGGLIPAKAPSHRHPLSVISPVAPLCPAPSRPSRIRPNRIRSMRPAPGTSFGPGAAGLSPKRRLQTGSAASAARAPPEAEARTGSRTHGGSMPMPGLHRAPAPAVRAYPQQLLHTSSVAIRRRR